MRRVRVEGTEAAISLETEWGQRLVTVAWAGSRPDRRRCHRADAAHRARHTSRSAVAGRVRPAEADRSLQPSPLLFADSLSLRWSPYLPVPRRTRSCDPRER